jgi:hypothetical protein
MNRHERRARKASGLSDASPASQDVNAASPVPAERPGVLLKLFSRILLGNWVLKRVNHPDLLTILLQIAEQTGRTDAVVQITTKLHVLNR